MEKEVQTDSTDNLSDEKVNQNSNHIFSVDSNSEATLSLSEMIAKFFSGQGEPPFPFKRLWHSGNFDPDTKANADDPRLSDARPAAGGDAATLAQIGPAGFARAYSGWVEFGNNNNNNNNNITTAQFITLLTDMGAFSQPYWMARGGWAYAYNQTITDTGIGNISLAGSVVEVMGIPAHYTIRITTPSTAATSNETKRVFIYINNGDDYSPGWFKLANANETFSENRGDIDNSQLNVFVNRPSGTYRVMFPGYTDQLTVFKGAGSASALELWHNFYTTF